MDFTIKEREDILKACDMIGKRVLNIDDCCVEYIKIKDRTPKDGRKVDDYEAVRAPTLGMGFGFIYGFITRVSNCRYKVSDKYIVNEIYVTESFDCLFYNKDIERDWHFLDRVKFNTNMFFPKMIIVELKDIRNGKGVRIGVLDGKYIVSIPSVLELCGY